MEMDTQASSDKVTSPFLRLPGEIRNIIYNELLRSRYHDRPITPDRNKLRRKYAPKLWSRVSVGDSLPFLRVCKQISNEGAAVLYGSHIFFFSDEAHNTVKVRLPGYDSECHPTDFTSMYYWLCCIGHKNRAIIKRLHFEFTTPRYLWYSPKLDDIDCFQGDFHLVRSLEMLSKSHSIQSIRLWFRVSYVEKLRHFDLAFADAGTPIFQKLMSIRGIREMEAQFAVVPTLRPWRLTKLIPIGDGQDLELFRKCTDDSFYRAAIANFMDARALMTTNRYPGFNDVVRPLLDKLTTASNIRTDEAVSSTDRSLIDLLRIMVQDREATGGFAGQLEKREEEIPRPTEKTLRSTKKTVKGQVGNRRLQAEIKHKDSWEAVELELVNDILCGHR